MGEEHFYEVNVRWTDQRKGMLSVSGMPDVEVATPPEFPGGHKNIWSPEHLLVAAANSCLMTTFLAIAEFSKLEFVSFKCRAKGKMEKVENRWMITEITFYPELIVPAGMDIDKANRILQKSEAACLISNSIKAKTLMEMVIKYAEAQ